ncbi:MAG: tRNA (adenosine(37)-N6)-dimethylallyltransferase MiaA [Magnetococcales bacterium]|nr:tRNA (adenosine(37)-N6)-dimethylallyltransferase MiaA [Magnetococcales bacterium]
MGPTASGKSALALHLATQWPLEIVNADSVQVYRGMEIGTAKPTAEERRRVRHHLLDLLDPDSFFSAGAYRRCALTVVAACHARGCVPIFVGGSGLYFRAIEQGLAPVPPVPEAIVRALREEGGRVGWPVLHARLAVVDPTLAARLSPGDAQRIIRGLAVSEATGKPLTHWQRQSHAPITTPILKLAIDWPRDALYARIDQRFDQMMAQGFLDEVAALRRRGINRDLPAMKAVGYRQLLRHLDGELSLAAAVDLGKQESRRYAKRQLTWLRREAGLVWLPVGLEGVTLAEGHARACVASFIGHAMPMRDHPHEPASEERPAD